MCTIVLAWNVLADAPVAIAANRDEAVDREARPPRLLGDDPQVVAPQDARAGGTWIGVSERGLLVAITNRWTEPPEPVRSDATTAVETDATTADTAGDRRSRGLLVRDALDAADATEALEVVREALAADSYAGFNLLIADAERATYLEWDGHAPADAATEDGASAGAAADGLRERDLEPGIHAIVNPGLNEVDDRAERLREVLAVDGASPAAGVWLDAAAERLRDHDFGLCVHGDGFGTRSSSLVSIGADGHARYAFADGPPCETDYEQVEVPASFLEGSF